MTLLCYQTTAVKIIIKQYIIRRLVHHHMVPDGQMADLIVCWGKQQAVTASCTNTNGGWFHLFYVRTLSLTRVAKLPCSTLDSVPRDLRSLVVDSYTDHLFHNTHNYMPWLWKKQILLKL